MRHIVPLLFASITTASLAATAEPAWYGYRGDGSAVAPDSNPPVFCDSATSNNILWKAPMPNWGHGSPCVVAGKVFTTSEGGWKEDFPVLTCHDANSGKELWRAELDHLPAVDGLSDEEKTAIRKTWSDLMAEYRAVNRAWNAVFHATDKEAAIAKFNAETGWKYGPEASGGYLEACRRNSPAPKEIAKAGLTLDSWYHSHGDGIECVGQTFPTPVSDGRHVWVVTAFGGFFCFDLDGKLVWRAYHPGKTGEYCRNARSPILWKDLLLCDTTSLARGIEKSTGKLLWKGPVSEETIVTPVIITSGTNDIVLFHGPTAFRLPDGAPLKVDGWSNAGGTMLVKSDERDVVFFTGGGEHGGWAGKGADPNPPPAAVRFTLNGDTLKATVLWAGINGKGAASHTAITYHQGRLYTGSAILDALTGAVVLSGDKNRRVTPQTSHLLWIAGDRIYGLSGGAGSMRNIKSGSPPPQAATLSVFNLKGTELARNTLVGPAANEGDKTLQCSSQNGRDLWTFAYGYPFTVSGDRIYVRGFDYLWCIGHAARTGDPKQLAQVAAASPEALIGMLDDATPAVRAAAVERLIALKNPAARSALEKRLSEDGQAEIRAKAVQALDALDPATAAGTTALRALLVPALLDAREWWKPEKVAAWNRLRPVVVALGPAGDPLVIGLLNDKDDNTRASGLTLAETSFWPPSVPLRDALLDLATKGKGDQKTRATAILAARNPTDEVIAKFLAGILAQAKTDSRVGDEGRVALESTLAATAPSGRGALLRETLTTTASPAVFKAASDLAVTNILSADDRFALLEQRVNDRTPGAAVPAAAAEALSRSTPPDRVAAILAKVIDHPDSAVVRTTANTILNLNAGHEAEVLAAIEKMIAGPKDGATRVAGEMLNRSPSLKDPALRKQAATLLVRMLSIENPELQRWACGALAGLGKDGAPAVDRLKELSTSATDEALKKQASEAATKVAAP
jgi:hypothetical protein